MGSSCCTSGALCALGAAREHDCHLECFHGLQPPEAWKISRCGEKQRNRESVLVVLEPSNHDKEPHAGVAEEANVAFPVYTRPYMFAKDLSFCEQWYNSELNRRKELRVQLFARQKSGKTTLLSRLCQSAQRECALESGKETVFHIVWRSRNGQSFRLHVLDTYTPVSKEQRERKAQEMVEEKEWDSGNDIATTDEKKERRRVARDLLAADEIARNTSKKLHYMRYGDVYLFMYASGDRKSFAWMKRRFENAKSYMFYHHKDALNRVAMVIVCNKCDTDRRWDDLKGPSYAKKQGIPFVHCSARDGTNIQLLLEIAIKEFWYRTRGF